MMELGELPAGWLATTLGEVASWSSGGTPSRSRPEYFRGNIPWIKSGELGAKYIRDAEESISETAIAHSSAKVFPKGAVGIAMYGATIGKLSIWGIDASTNQACAVGVCGEELNNEFLYYFLASEKRNLIKAGKGGAQPNISQGVIREWPFNLPPLAEQHRIVAKIEELFSELDQGVASLKTAREQLKVYRQSLLKNAFKGKLTAATGWREKPLGQLLGFLTSGSRGWAAYYATSGDLFVRAQNIKHDRFELDDVAFVALPDKAEGLRTRIQQGDLLITITGANVTKSALVKHDLGVAYVSQHVALCRPTAEILPEYLYWFIVAEAAGRKQLTDMAYGAGKPGLNLENIRSVNVPFPSLHEQQEIVEQIESKLSEADQLDQTLATALQQADALRQAILKKAFCGQLVKQDKNEEPATALLERIRAGKSNGMSTPRNRRKSG